MASVKYGTIVTELKGKIGGNVFQGGRAAPTLKKLWGYIRKQDQAQLSWNNIKRAEFAVVTQTWRTLTDEQRTSWSAAAPSFPFYNKFGDSYTGTGYQLYMQCNLLYYVIHSEVLTVAPSVTEFPNGSLITMSELTPSRFTLHYPTAPGAGWYLDVQATAGFSPGANMGRGGYKKLGLKTFNDDNNAIFIAQYKARFGAPVVDTLIKVRCKWVEEVSGLSSQWFYINALVTAS